MVVRDAVRLGVAEIHVADEMLRIKVDGDLIARTDAPVERRMAAMQSILRDITGRRIVIEKRMVERDVIVARGEWHRNRDKMNDPEPGKIGDPNPYQYVHYNSVGDLVSFLNRLADVTNRIIVDEIERLRPESVEWTESSLQYEARKSQEKQDQLLENLARQTSLQFSNSRRVVPVWFVFDEHATNEVNIKLGESR